MRSYVRAIMIFNEKGELRQVPLKPGVNIVTGESKTGKSALVEILDYCLCSSRSTIPKGKITEFAYLYVIPMFINQNTYVIARYNGDKGKKMYVVKEEAEFPVENITLDYFRDKIELAVNNAKYEIESALGLYVTNIVTDDEQKSKKASLRNMVSYLFQHQNLMASKFALFYRFSNFYKRKDTIEQFPVFTGMVGQQYYSDLIELNNLKNELAKKKKKQQSNAKSINYVKDNLQPLLQNYYALLNISFDSTLSTQQMLRMASNLPDFDDSQLFDEKGIAERYRELNKKLDALRDHERDVLLKIRNLDDAGQNGEGFINMLQELKDQTTVAKASSEEYACPFCGNEYKELTKDTALLLEATTWLDNELKITSKYTKDFSEDVRKFKEIHRGIEEEIKAVWQQIKEIERKYLNSKGLASKREKIYYAKTRIELFAEVAKSGALQSVDEDITELEGKIKDLEKKVDKANLVAKKLEAQKFLSDNMNRLSQTLDFEDEYRPINLNFELVNDTFDIYQHQENDEKIFLDEMGSGANWVSCHIALFLSLLRYFATQKKSPMLLTAFFDQPSQVYFPQGTIEQKNELKSSDLNAVNQMYKTIFDEINLIGENTGILPQILIVDHVDGQDLEIKDEFLSYIRRDWRNGKGFI